MKLNQNYLEISCVFSIVRIFLVLCWLRTTLGLIKLACGDHQLVMIPKLETLKEDVPRMIPRMVDRVWGAQITFLKAWMVRWLEQELEEWRMLCMDTYWTQMRKLWNWAQRIKQNKSLMWFGLNKLWMRTSWATRVGGLKNWSPIDGFVGLMDRQPIRVY